MGSWASDCGQETVSYEWALLLVVTVHDRLRLWVTPGEGGGASYSGFEVTGSFRREPATPVTHRGDESNV